MIVLQKILVPTDFSAGAAAALEFAVDVSRRYDGAVTLLHVNELTLDFVPLGALPPTFIESWLGEANQQLEELKGKAQAAGARDVETTLVHGSPYWEIVRYAENEKFDLIVMGTHGRTGIQRALIGSVAERVVRRAPCAVLTVHLREPPSEKT